MPILWNGWKGSCDMARDSKRQDLPFDQVTAQLLGSGKGEQDTRPARMSSAQYRKWQYDRRRSKATYDLPLEVKAAINALSAEWDCSRSDVAAWLLVMGIRQLRAGSVPEPEKAPSAAGNLRYGHSLVLPPISSVQPVAGDVAGIVAGDEG